MIKNIRLPLAHMFAGIMCAVASGSAIADLIPDYYEEAGVSADRDYLNQSESEFIDPFSGTLNLLYTDLVIPGTGGMDIKIQRSYSNFHNIPNPYLPRRTPTGFGWNTIHFGRVLYSQANFCPSGVVPVDVSGNPVLELPDGSRQILAESDVIATGSRYITKNLWKAECATYNNATGVVQGLRVFSPDGTKYDMAWLDASANTLYPTKITDRNNNTLTLNYTITTAGGYTRIDSVSANGILAVTFGYTDIPGTNDFLMTSITANNKTWQYSYTKIPGETLPLYYLTKVTRPDGLFWAYDYKSTSGSGIYSIQTVTHPHGGKVDYTYQDIAFYARVPPRIQTAVNTKKTKSNGITVDGTWTYTFDKIGVLDRTRVATPNGAITYTHFGLTAAQNAAGSMWKVGLLLEKNINDTKFEKYTWDKGITVSTQNYSRPSVVYAWSNDPNYYAPVLTAKEITLDNTVYITRYLTYDAYGNPTTIEEQGYDGGGAGTLSLPTPTRTTTQTYKYLTGAGQWILHLPDTTRVNTTVSVAKTYDANGNMLTNSRFGMAKSYTYYPATGDLWTYRDQNNNQTTYSSYKRGIAQIEDQPDVTRVSRVINNDGTIASFTDGGGYQTGYQYDGLGQLTRITPPDLKTVISITHGKTSRILTRGAFKQTVGYDGFGRVASVTNEDTATGTKSVVKYQYNALGEKVFESYPATTLSSSGIDYVVDALGRVTQATYFGGGVERFQYLSQNKVKYTDQRGTITNYGYRSYGDPNERVLTKVDGSGSLTTIRYDDFGNILNITQDNKSRSYTYYPNKYLHTITNPETGTTTFGRDNVGNMLSRQVGTSPITNYTYDGHNRLKTITYPAGTPNVTYTYFKTGNIESVSNGVGNRSFLYDGTGNLTSETLAIDGISFTTDYDVNALEHLNAITYPSGKTVTYSPDALGRPTKAAPYTSPNISPAVHYHPNGMVKDYLHANGVRTDVAQNTRQWIASISVNANTPISRVYGYDNNGNVETISDNYDSTFGVGLQYDRLNRLTGATGAWGTAGGLTYDSTGDIGTYTLGSTTTSYAYDATTGLLSSTSGISNRTYSYDVYGNVTGNSQYTFTYNDASNLIAAAPVSVGTSASYQYDGDGMRVSETKNGAKIYYVYNKAGKLLGEYAADGSMRRENIYLDNRLVAKVENVPSAPATITAPANDPDGVYAVTWVASATTSVDHYQLYEAIDSTFTNPTLVYDGPATTTSLSGKAVGFYYYRVRACAAELCSDFTVTPSNTFVGVIPGAPGTLTVPATNDSGSYALGWGSSTGDLTEYQLYESTVPDFSTVTSVYTGTALTSSVSGRLSGTYYYRVRACYKSGIESVCGAYTNGANSTVVDRIPQIPTSITVPTIESDGAYPVSWGMADGYGKPVSYELYESTDAAFVGEARVYVGTLTATNLTGRMVGTTYYYRVRSCTDTKCSGFMTAATGVTPDGLPPGIPGSITVPVSNNTGEFFVTWTTGAGDLSNYELYQADNPAFTGETLVSDADGKPLEERFYYLPTGTYYYRVRACNAIACSSPVEGANPIAVIQPPPVPLSISAPATDGDGTYTVSWIGAGGATFTHYELTEASASGSSIVYSGVAESFDISYRENDQYTYSLRACSVDACSSSISTMVSVTLLSGFSIQYQSLPEFNYTGGYTVSWSATYAGGSMPSITSFILEESTSSSFVTVSGRYTVQPGASNSGSKSVSHTSNGTYYYRVRVCSGNDNCTAFIQAAHGVIETSVPKVDASKSFAVRWDPFNPDSAGVATFYELYQSNNAGFTGQVKIYSGNNLSVIITPADDGYYYYRVRKCLDIRIVGEITTCSEYHPVYYHTREIGFKIFPAVMSAINTLLLN